jgi:multidrug efflux system membrane fusion protein
MSIRDVVEATPAHRRNATRWILVVVGVLLVAGAVWVLRHRAASSAPIGAQGTGDRIVPVSVAVVQKKDVPIYLEGLGNVLPIAQVTVKTQVEGRLDRVMFTEGQTVKKGDPLAQVDPRPFTIQLHQAEAALLRDNAQLRNAQLNLDRYKTLRQQNLIPQQQVDDQQTMVDQLTATARSDQTQIENAKLQLDYAHIVSPIDGVVGVRQVDPGNLVHVADTNGIVVVTQLDPIAVLFTLAQDDLPRVSKQLAQDRVPVDAYSRDGTRKLGSGQLVVIDNQVNAQTATIRLKATFPNPTRALWPNAFVKARLLLETRKDVLVVPATAVQRGPQGTFVYLVAPDRTAASRAIELEATEGDQAIVAKGLAVGDQVVTDGQNQLRPGAKVAPRP